jgi:hypothetical protein
MVAGGEKGMRIFGKRRRDEDEDEDEDKNGG